MRGSFVRTGLWPSLAVLALGVAVLSQCGGDQVGPVDNGKTAPDSIFKATADPIDATVTLDAAQAVTDTITPEDGGTIDATGGDGTTYSLDIPVGAVDDTTIITLTPIASMTGVQLSNGVVAGVQMSPDGLEFNQDATLTIVPTKDIPVANQTFLGYSGSGQNVHLAAPASTDPDITIRVSHFSGVSVGNGTTSDRAAILAHGARDAKLVLDGLIAAYTTGQRQGSLLGTQDGVLDPDLLQKYLDAYDRDVIQPLIDAASQDCTHGVFALQVLGSYLHERAVAGFEPTDQQIADLTKVNDAVKSCAFRTVPDAAGLQLLHGRICSSGQPFTLTLDKEVLGNTFGTVTVKFSPSSVLNGSMSWNASDPDESITSNGTYQITVPAAAIAEGRPLIPGLKTVEHVCETLVAEGPQPCTDGTGFAVNLKRISGC